MRAVDALADVLVRRRWLVLSLVLVLTALLAPGVARLDFGYNVESLLRQTGEPEPALRHYDRFPLPDNVLLFGFPAAEPLGDAARTSLRSFEERVRAVPGVARLLSVESAPGLAGLAGPELADKLAASRLYRRLLVAKDALCGLVQLDVSTRNTADRRRIVAAIEQHAEALGLDLRLTGFPVLREGYIERIKADQRLFIPLALAVCTLLCFALVPGIGLALGTLLVVPLTLIWTFGSLGWLGATLSVVSSTLPTLIMVIAVGDAVHVALRYREERQAGSERQAASADALRHSLLPVFLTSLTTAIGFGSFAVASVPDLRDLGLFAALGVGLAFVLTTVALPGLLPPLARWPGEGDLVRGSPGSRLLSALAVRLGSLPPRLVLPVAGLLIAVAAFFSLRVTSDAYLTEDLWPDDPLVHTLRWFEQRTVGPLSGEILVEARQGGLADPDNVAELERFLAWVESRPGVIRTLSFTDALADGLPRPLLALLGREPLSLFDAEMRTARVLVFFQDVGARAIEDYLVAVREQGAALERISARPAGLQVVANARVIGLIEDMKGSFWLAFGLISLVMASVFGSLRFGVIALVPNVMPLILTLGYMGLAGMKLRIVVVMTFAIAFGLAVDNTIHLLSRFRAERRAGLDVEAAIQRALQGVGAAAFTASLLLFVGFALLLFSGFRASHDFGLLACITIVFALLGDIVLLPALLRVFAARPSPRS